MVHPSAIHNTSPAAVKFSSADLKRDGEILARLDAAAPDDNTQRVTVIEIRRLFERRRRLEYR